VKTFLKTQNRVVRDKLIRARRPWPTKARAIVSQQQIAQLARISQAILSNFGTAKTGPGRRYSAIGPVDADAPAHRRICLRSLVPGIGIEPIRLFESRDFKFQPDFSRTR